MIRVGALVVLLALQGLEAQPLSPAHDSVRLELEGRLPEAWSAYHVALLSRDFGADDSPAARQLRVFLLSKLAWLSVSLGRTEEAWDLGLQLLAMGTTEAKKAGESVHKRLTGGGIAPWKVPVGWKILADPSGLFPASVASYARLQLGAFRDWSHARTLLDMLAEKGWVAWVEDRVVKKERLQAIFVLSHSASIDLKQLKDQGFEPSLVAVTTR